MNQVVGIVGGGLASASVALAANGRLLRRLYMKSAFYLEPIS